ncbi:MAG: PilT/PilU family type 4a pilus ATPase [Phascolarctobacterium sp.]|uniref:type IV pilus twitching motility protein PilT n=1 Tax=Phascolarctobacterium sp. TaxID=2049039 RepID=UPI0026DAF4EC|nr:PilT/PilU family type 4a pilus ATPase [Phascolarctobacterium sp.]MDO4921186.1 PilT/PilU family type 4a pilus ATPase [Phascolarctobacterium sp.]
MLNDLLQKARVAGASDLHLTIGCVPVMRVLGILQPLAERIVSREDLAAAIALLPVWAQDALKRQGEADCAWTDGQGQRCRWNVFRQRGEYAAAIRLLSDTAPDCVALGLPDALCRQLEKRQGLILVTGPTGSGKSTTLAALVQQLNRTQALHIVTLEDPVEYCYEAGLALIHQREVGRDTESFASGLRSALREDPDVILVGELRDAASIAIALTAAETGHLVLATMHTGDVSSSVSRILEALPQNQQQARSQLAACLQAVACQKLLPRADGKGRVAAFELLIATDALRTLIREGQIHQLSSYIQMGGRLGMLTMEESIKRLRQNGIINIR